MLSAKGQGRHSIVGRVYRWCLGALFVSATLLAVMRWAENYHLFVIGALAFSSAWLGHRAIQKRWPYWTRMHITGMGLSYTLILVAFYLDNGPQLPLWKVLPHFTYWLLPLCCRVAFDYSRIDEPSVAAIRRPNIVGSDKGSINTSQCPLLAQSGHSKIVDQCPLLGVKRTSLPHRKMSAYDPKRTSPSLSYIVICRVTIISK